MIKRIGIVYLIASVSLAARPGRKRARLVIYKIGRTQLGRRKRRLSEISRSTAGSKEYMIAFAPAPAAWLEEQLHSLFESWQYTYKGSGKREYFWPACPAYLRIALALLSMLLLQAGPAAAIAAFLLALLLPDLLLILPTVALLALAWALFFTIVLALPCAALMLLSF